MRAKGGSLRGGEGGSLRGRVVSKWVEGEGQRGREGVGEGGSR